MSNTCAIVTAVAAGLVPNGWWIDPAGAIAISVYIVTRWLAIAKQQVSSMCCLYGFSGQKRVVPLACGHAPRQN